MASSRKPVVLVVDDEKDIRGSLRMILEYEKLDVIEAESGPKGVIAIREKHPDVVLLDIKMPQMDGLEVLEQVRNEHPDLPVVMISGHGTVGDAVKATQLGAFDFMEKPLERDRVLLVLRNALDRRRLAEENRELRDTVENRFQMVGESPALMEVQDDIARAAPTKASVLITGESGTGKELVARAIHTHSPRAAEPFVKVNCAAIPEELIESELFGHVKGSFTGASKDQTGKFVQADGGTIFLDEIGDMSLKTQAKVLRVLQDGDVEPVGAAKALTVDVRVVAATNKDLQAEIESNAFREDLYFRLNVVPIHLPPLRDRADDIPLLVRHFAEEFCRDNNFKCKEFTTKALAALQAEPWRGNIRELRNAVERLLIMAPDERIDVKDIPQGLGMPLAEGAITGGEGLVAVGWKRVGLQQFKDTAERAFLVAHLCDQDWNIAATAKAIETPRSNLYKKLEAYGISKEQDG